MFPALDVIVENDIAVRFIAVVLSSFSLYGTALFWRTMIELESIKIYNADIENTPSAK